jgi:hypothetical protein
MELFEDKKIQYLNWACGANIHRLQGEYAVSMATNPTNYEHYHFRVPTENITFLYGQQNKIFPQNKLINSLQLNHAVSGIINHRGSSSG